MVLTVCSVCLLDTPIVSNILSLNRKILDAELLIDRVTDADSYNRVENIPEL